MNEMIAKFQVISIFLVLALHVHADYYSREVLESKYPGYGTDFVFFPRGDGPPFKEYLNGSVRSWPFSQQVQENDVKLVYYSREHVEGVNMGSKSNLTQYVDPSKPTKFVTHGWMSGGQTKSPIQIKNGFLHRYDANVFIMDWSAIAQTFFYPSVVWKLIDVAKFYASYLNHLVDEVGLKPEDIHMIGHSMGAHISGFAARLVKNGQIGRITGLDPAGPCICEYCGICDLVCKPVKLTKSDANFVDVIHTTAGLLGCKRPLGHVDFYPNGGYEPQPGCNSLSETGCSHGRSWDIFANSLVRAEPLLAHKCSNWAELEKKDCKGAATPIGDSTWSNVSGIFYSQILPEDIADNKTTKLTTHI